VNKLLKKIPKNPIFVISLLITISNIPKIIYFLSDFPGGH